MVDLRGLITIGVIVLLAGVIAYIGDRVGHQVGRRRMTLFGLRPRYTSTIFAVGFGMLIAVAAVAILSAISHDARQALFSINKLNQQIETLTQERDQLLQDPVVLRSGEALTSPVIVKSTDPQAVIERQLANLFVVVANFYRDLPGVRPYPKDPLTPDAREKISAVAKAIRELNPVPAIVVPVAAENIIRNGTMRIGFSVYKDVLMYRKEEIITSVAIRNAKNVDQDRSALVQLINGVKTSALAHGMPPLIAAYPTTPGTTLDAFLNKLLATSGPAIVKAVAVNDIYAHGPLNAELAVSSLSTR